MSDLLEPGSKCICQAEDWYNAFGERQDKIPVGTRLQVVDRVRVAGASFLKFEEYPNLLFLSTGFKSLRSLN